MEAICAVVLLNGVMENLQNCQVMIPAILDTYLK